jgi:hypothetical protein
LIPTNADLHPRPSRTATPITTDSPPEFNAHLAKSTPIPTKESSPHRIAQYRTHEKLLKSSFKTHNKSP